MREVREKSYMPGEYLFGAWDIQPKLCGLIGIGSDGRASTEWGWEFAFYGCSQIRVTQSTWSPNQK